MVPVILFMALTLATVLPVAADEVKLTPSIGMRLEFNDNIFFSAADPVRDTITTVSPGLEIAGRSERRTAQLSGRLHRRWYAENPDLEATDYDVLGLFAYEMTPRFSLSIDGGVVRDSRPDRDVDVTGIVLGTQPRTRPQFSVSGRYSLSELTRTSLSYRFYHDNWDDPTLNDTFASTLGWDITHNIERLVPRTHGIFSVTASHYDYARAYATTSGISQFSLDQRTVADYLSLTAGASHSLSELDSLQLRLGAAYTNTEQTTSSSNTLLVPPGGTISQRDERTDSGWGGIGAVDYRYDGYQSTFTASASEDVGAPTATSGLTLRTAFRAGVSHQFTDAWTGNLDGSYIINTADNQKLLIQDTDTQTFNLSPRIIYRWSRYVGFQAGYRYSWTRDNIDGVQSERNLIFGTLNLSWDLLD